MTIFEALWQDAGRMSGAVCFRDTRIPVSILFEYLEAGQLEEFFDGYPDVSRQQVHTVLQASEEMLTAQVAGRKAG